MFRSYIYMYKKVFELLTRSGIFYKHFQWLWLHVASIDVYNLVHLLFFSQVIVGSRNCHNYWTLNSYSWGCYTRVSNWVLLSISLQTNSQFWSWESLIFISLSIFNHAFFIYLFDLITYAIKLFMSLHFTFCINFIYLYVC